MTKFGLAQTLILPAHQNPLKGAALASDENRLEMCELACVEADLIERVEIRRDEIERPGPSYTVDTIEALDRERRARWSLILGSDAFRMLSRWHRVSDLLERTDLILAVRDYPIDLETVAATLNQIGLKDIERAGEQIWHSENRRSVSILDETAPRVSASELRRSLREHPTQRPEALHSSVWEYIKQNRLYSDR